MSTDSTHDRHSGGEAAVVLVTFPDEQVALRCARRIVETGLAACVNLVPAITSVYAWRGAVHEDGEVLALIKTTARALQELESQLLDLHPYDTPEFVALSPRHVEARYMAWLSGAVHGGAEAPAAVDDGEGGP